MFFKVYLTCLDNTRLFTLKENNLKKELQTDAKLTRKMESEKLVPQQSEKKHDLGSKLK